MTDTSYSIPTIPGHEAHSAPTFPSTSRSLHTQQTAPDHDSAQEDEGQISCICGFNDDDGSTVACDLCNKWQHIVCYYPEFEHNIPEDLQHYCVDCQPRPIDSEGAKLRQKRSRYERDVAANGFRRQAAKSSKKKKDTPGATHTNGWPMDKSRHDRNSASPRDQPPPAKRPKTTHRQSNSTVGLSVGRRRNGSTAAHRRSTSETPETPQELYSTTFLRSYLEDDWSVTKVNLFNGIQVTNTLSQWLHQPEDDFRNENGVDRGEVFMRWDGDINEITQAQIEIEEKHDDTVGTFNVGDIDTFPTWKSVTLRDPVAEGACIGELKGHIGLKGEYYDDPANRWSTLRHPEPFVFFHAKLPVFVDARNEGSELRYLRRSCFPNARLQIMITDGTEYHFCFMATRHIEPGEEVAVAWDTQDGLGHTFNSKNNHSGIPDKTTLRLWASTVLANCGPCACEKDPPDCMMSRFDRRGQPLYDDDELVPATKAPKSRKKKLPHQISPLNTGQAVNSRSGSEARKVDLDDQSDSRSASGSAGRESVSRDITPNTHYSTNGSTSAIPELSERERKKLAKEEEMFRRQEEEASGKHKKKRGSAGSALNTPAANTTKTFGFPLNGASKYTDAGTSRQAGLPSAKSTGKRGKGANMPTDKSGSSESRAVRQPRPEYVNATTQCDLDEEEAAQRAPSPTTIRKYISVTQRLLERCALNNAKRKRACCTTGSPPSRKSSDGSGSDSSKADHSSSSPTTSIDARKQQPLPPVEDVEMEDISAGSTKLPTTSSPSVPQHASPLQSRSPNVSSNPIVEPPAPPWSAKSSSPASEKPAFSPDARRSPNMHLQMPPPQANPFAAAAPSVSTPSASTPGASITGTLAQSPATMGAQQQPPVFSPAVTAAVNPSPARKKLSLSDYTKRSKVAKDKDNKDAPSDPTSSKGLSAPGGERESSPASTASGPVVPPLRPSSTEARQADEDGGSAIEEDVKMEDAPGATAPAPATGSAADGGIAAA